MAILEKKERCGACQRSMSLVDGIYAGKDADADIKRSMACLARHVHEKNSHNIIGREAYALSRMVFYQDFTTPARHMAIGRAGSAKEVVVAAANHIIKPPNVANSDEPLTKQPKLD